MPRSWLFAPRHKSLVHSHSSYRSVQNVCQLTTKPTAANDGEYRQLVSVCNTPRQEASSSLLRPAIKSTKGGSQIRSSSRRDRSPHSFDGTAAMSKCSKIREAWASGDRIFGHVTTGRGTIFIFRSKFCVGLGARLARISDRSCRAKPTLWPAPFGQAPTPGGLFFLLPQIFILSRGKLPGGPSDDQLFPPHNFICPAMASSCPDISRCCPRTPPSGWHPKRVSTQDKGRR